jgi:hypothetical protein
MGAQWFLIFLAVIVGIVSAAALRNGFESPPTKASLQAAKGPVASIVRKGTRRGTYRWFEIELTNTKAQYRIPEELVVPSGIRIEKVRQVDPRYRPVDMTKLGQDVFEIYELTMDGQPICSFDAATRFP